MTAALARRVVKAGAVYLIGFVVSRPALNAFLRRQMYRFPGLAARVRMAVSRSRRAHQPMASVITDEADLTDAARLVLRDLTHALEHRRQS
jgi:hypothetical protein